NAPTLIRTGTGSIDIAAANNISLLDMTAPGVIYTGGAPATGAPPPVSSESILAAKGNIGAYDVLVTNAVNPAGAGDITLRAQNKINGIEEVGGGPESGGQSQFWYEWMQTGNVVNSSGQTIQTSINFGAFDQGIMSIGGNVTVSAGGDIKNLA